ncbi:hypothetical protein CEXT_344821 [Caerostris extrusa]|uniref:Uncharacterized protein n=1 Tax=Caerostris extrusa TaxID=172846 RepID=A0AAV4P2R2_CAEEX|nr:hypothetical protein CEXT_344821 [Caerostris extrusa]
MGEPQPTTTHFWFLVAFLISHCQRSSNPKLPTPAGTESRSVVLEEDPDPSTNDVNASTPSPSPYIKRKEISSLASIRTNPWEKTRLRKAHQPEDDDPRLECGPNPWNFAAQIDSEGDGHKQCSKGVKERAAVYGMVTRRRRMILDQA